MNNDTKLKAKIRTKDIELDENVEFSDMNLSKEIQMGLKQAGFVKPSPIQLKSIPLGKLGLDLIVQAKSGTGKTCVFSVIALESVILESRTLQALILTPTREIALQVMEFIRKISKNMKKLKCHAFIGGQSLNEDKQKLNWCHIAVGTPGRIYHLISEKLLKTENIRLFVIDEADKLLAPEFQKDINLIYSNLPENKQMIALSATYPSFIATYVTRYMRSATFVRLNIIDPSLRGIKQYYKVLHSSKLPNEIFDAKIEEIINIFASIKFTQAIVFTNYQMKAEYLCQSLVDKNWPAVFIAGNIDQLKRNEAISQLKQFKCRILVSTDLTARGIDIDSVDLIINMEAPLDAETYLHRIGRAGRYGCEGYAISLVAENEELELFKGIINQYNLCICEYGKNLDEIVSVNEPNDDKIDDMTIEKVKFSEKELHQSINEYKKAKNDFELKKKLYRQKIDDIRPKERPNDSIINFFTCISDIEKSVETFKATNKFECLDVEKRSKTVYVLKNSNIKSLTIREINDKEKELIKILKPYELSRYEIQKNLESVSNNNKFDTETNSSTNADNTDSYNVYCERYSQFYFRYLSQFFKN